jgi:hypothetical protein
LREAKAFGEFADSYFVDCQTCGRFKITQRLIELLSGPSFSESKHLLSGRTREFTLKGASPLFLTEDVAGQLVAELGTLSVHERAMKLLENLAVMTTEPGERLILQNGDFPLSFSKDLLGLLYFLKYLNNEGFISYSSPISTVTVAGYERLADWQRPNMDSDRAFVAMWFDKSMDEAFENGIEKAVEDAGYECNRVDRGRTADKLGKIDDEIIAGIREARFVVADFTHDRSAVYYEAGLAEGFGIPVILCCKNEKKDVKDLSFDTRNYNHILWENSDDLRKRLYDRIRAAIGQGKRKPPE